jgi:glycosyltransferase involved in cell wall biosynthesis
MRILLVGRHHGREIRGATVATHGLARALVSRGHEVSLLHSAAPEHRIHLQGVKSLYLQSPHKSVYPLRCATRSLAPFDIVHSNDEAGGGFALRSRFAPLPFVGQLNPPVVKPDTFWQAGWRWRYIGMVARYAPRVLTPSRWLADALSARYARDPAQFSVVPYGIGEHWFEPVQAATAEVPRIVLVNMKGIETALRAIARLRDKHSFTLELYGLHPETESYRRLAGELGVEDRVHFQGFVPNLDLPAKLAGASILLHPTPSESFGQVLAEAAAQGIPAVSSRVNAVPEVVEDGVTGLLCPVGDDAAFADALDRLLSSEGLLKQMAGAARARADENWHWNAVATRLETEVYARLTRS